MRNSLALTRKQALVTVGVFTALTLLSATILFLDDYAFSGMGFRNKEHWDWLDLLIVPATLTGGGFWLSRVQRKRDRKLEER